MWDLRPSVTAAMPQSTGSPYTRRRLGKGGNPGEGDLSGHRELAQKA